MKKFFIVGCPRSGTTLLQQALNRHSQIVIPPETKFFFSFVGHSKRAQRKHVQRLNADLKIKLPIPAQRIGCPREARRFYEHMAERYLDQLHRKDILYFGEKTPEHTGHLHRIQAIFPDAPIMLIYRDGRDVALSLTKMPWMDSDLYVTFAIWLYYYQFHKRASNDPSLKLHCIRYEDFVRCPAVELEKITQLLGLNYEPAMAEGYGNREGVPEGELTWKARALERIAADRIGIWQRELSASQIRTLESWGGDVLKTLGYEVSTSAEERLPWSFFPVLSWKLLRLLHRLPLRMVANELCSRCVSFRRA